MTTGSPFSSDPFRLTVLSADEQPNPSPFNPNPVAAVVVGANASSLLFPQPTAMSTQASHTSSRSPASAFHSQLAVVPAQCDTPSSSHLSEGSAAGRLLCHRPASEEEAPIPVALALGLDTTGGLGLSGAFGAMLCSNNADAEDSTTVLSRWSVRAGAGATNATAKAPAGDSNRLAHQLQRNSAHESSTTYTHTVVSNATATTAEQRQRPTRAAVNRSPASECATLSPLIHQHGGVGFAAVSASTSSPSPSVGLLPFNTIGSNLQPRGAVIPASAASTQDGRLRGRRAATQRDHQQRAAGNGVEYITNNSNPPTTERAAAEAVQGMLMSLASTSNTSSVSDATALIPMIGEGMAGPTSGLGLPAPNLTLALPPPPLLLATPRSLPSRRADVLAFHAASLHQQEQQRQDFFDSVLAEESCGGGGEGGGRKLSGDRQKSDGAVSGRTDSISSKTRHQYGKGGSHATPSLGSSRTLSTMAAAAATGGGDGRLLLAATPKEEDGVVDKTRTPRTAANPSQRDGRNPVVVFQRLSAASSSPAAITNNNSKEKASPHATPEGRGNSNNTNNSNPLGSQTFNAFQRSSNSLRVQGSRRFDTAPSPRRHEEEEEERPFITTDLVRHGLRMATTAQSASGRLGIAGFGFSSGGGGGKDATSRQQKRSNSRSGRSAARSFSNNSSTSSSIVLDACSTSDTSFGLQARGATRASGGSSSLSASQSRGQNDGLPLGPLTHHFVAGSFGLVSPPPPAPLPFGEERKARRGSGDNVIGGGVERFAPLSHPAFAMVQPYAASPPPPRPSKVDSHSSGRHPLFGEGEEEDGPLGCQEGGDFASTIFSLNQNSDYNSNSNSNNGSCDNSSQRKTPKIPLPPTLAGGSAQKYLQRHSKESFGLNQIFVPLQPSSSAGTNSVSNNGGWTSLLGKQQLSSNGASSTITGTAAGGGIAAIVAHTAGSVHENPQPTSSAARDEVRIVSQKASTTTTAITRQHMSSSKLPVADSTHLVTSNNNTSSSSSRHLATLAANDFMPTTTRLFSLDSRLRAAAKKKRQTMEAEALRGGGGNPLTGSSSAGQFAAEERGLGQSLGNSPRDPSNGAGSHGAGGRLFVLDKKVNKGELIVTTNASSSRDSVAFAPPSSALSQSAGSFSSDSALTSARQDQQQQQQQGFVSIVPAPPPMLFPSKPLSEKPSAAAATSTATTAAVRSDATDKFERTLEGGVERLVVLTTDLLLSSTVHCPFFAVSDPNSNSQTADGTNTNTLNRSDCSMTAPHSTLNGSAMTTMLSPRSAETSTLRPPNSNSQTPHNTTTTGTAPSASAAPPHSHSQASTAEGGGTEMARRLSSFPFPSRSQHQQASSSDDVKAALVLRQQISSSSAHAHAYPSPPIHFLKHTCLAAGEVEKEEKEENEATHIGCGVLSACELQAASGGRSMIEPLQPSALLRSSAEYGDSAPLSLPASPPRSARGRLAPLFSLRSANSNPSTTQNSHHHHLALSPEVAGGGSSSSPSQHSSPSPPSPSGHRGGAVVGVSALRALRSERSNASPMINNNNHNHEGRNENEEEKGTTNPRHAPSPRRVTPVAEEGLPPLAHPNFASPPPLPPAPHQQQRPSQVLLNSILASFSPAEEEGDDPSAQLAASPVTLMCEGGGGGGGAEETHATRGPSAANNRSAALFVTITAEDDEHASPREAKRARRSKRSILATRADADDDEEEQEDTIASRSLLQLGAEAPTLVSGHINTTQRNSVSSVAFDTRSKSNVSFVWSGSRLPHHRPTDSVNDPNANPSSASGANPSAGVPPFYRSADSSVVTWGLRPREEMMAAALSTTSIASQQIQHSPSPPALSNFAALAGASLTSPAHRPHRVGVAAEPIPSRLPFRHAHDNMNIIAPMPLHSPTAAMPINLKRDGSAQKDDAVVAVDPTLMRSPSRLSSGGGASSHSHHVPSPPKRGHRGGEELLTIFTDAAGTTSTAGNINLLLGAIDHHCHPAFAREQQSEPFPSPDGSYNCPLNELFNAPLPFPTLPVSLATEGGVTRYLGDGATRHRMVHPNAIGADDANEESDVTEFGRHRLHAGRRTSNTTISITDDATSTTADSFFNSPIPPSTTTAALKALAQHHQSSTAATAGDSNARLASSPSRGGGDGAAHRYYLGVGGEKATVNISVELGTYTPLPINLSEEAPRSDDSDSCSTADPGERSAAVAMVVLQRRVDVGAGGVVEVPKSQLVISPSLSSGVPIGPVSAISGLGGAVGALSVNQSMESRLFTENALKESPTGLPYALASEQPSMKKTTSPSPCSIVPPAAALMMQRETSKSSDAHIDEGLIIDVRTLANSGVSHTSVAPVSENNICDLTLFVGAVAAAHAMPSVLTASGTRHGVGETSGIDLPIVVASLPTSTSRQPHLLPACTTARNDDDKDDHGLIAAKRKGEEGAVEGVKVPSPMDDTTSYYFPSSQLPPSAATEVVVNTNPTMTGGPTRQSLFHFGAEVRPSPLVAENSRNVSAGRAGNPLAV